MDFNTIYSTKAETRVIMQEAYEAAIDGLILDGIAIEDIELKPIPPGELPTPANLQKRKMTLAGDGTWTHPSIKATDINPAGSFYLSKTQSAVAWFDSNEWMLVNFRQSVTVTSDTGSSKELAASQELVTKIHKKIPEMHTDALSGGIIDDDNKILLGFDKQGKVAFIQFNDHIIDFKALKDVAIDFDMLAANIKTIDSLNSTSETNPLSANQGQKLSTSVRALNNFINAAVEQTKNATYSGGMVDGENKILLGFDKQGRINAAQFIDDLIEFKAIKDVHIKYDQLDENVRIKFFTEAESAITGYVLAFLDMENKILLGIRKDGKCIVGGIDINKLYADVQDIKNGVSITIEVHCCGDSMTAGAGGGGITYPNTLQTLMGNKYIVSNHGVGGEGTATICARMGSYPIVLQSDLVLPADNTTEVLIGTIDAKPKNAFGADISLLMQSSGNQVNPIMVAGVECTLVRRGTPRVDDTWYIKRNVAATSPTQLRAGDFIAPVRSMTLKRNQIGVIYIGQNGGYGIDGTSSNDTWIQYINSLVKFYQYREFVVVGLASGTRSSRATSDLAMLREFGQRFINTREIMTTHALKDLNITPTTDDQFTAEQRANGAISDTTCMSTGQMPSSLWASIFGVNGATSTDAIHGNAQFYSYLGQTIHKRLKQLNAI